MGKRELVLVCGVVALGLGTFVLLRAGREDEGRSKAAPTADVAIADEREEPSLADTDPARSTTDAGAERAHVTAEAAATSTPLEPVREDLYGVVLDGTDDTPLEGALVVVFGRDDRAETGSRPQAVLATDASGRFRLPALGAFGAREALIQMSGFVPRLPERIHTGTAHTFRLEPALSIAGRVRRATDRAPQAGVELSTWVGKLWDGERVVTNQVVSDDAGRFLLPNVRPRQQVSIRVRPPGSLAELRTLQTQDEPIRDYEILLGAPTLLRLRIVDLKTGVPLPAFRGRLRDGPAFVTDGAGLTSVGLDLARRRGQSGVRLAVEAGGYCTTRLLLAMDSLKGRLHDVPVTRGGRIEGVVRTPSGTPVQGAKINLHAQSNPLSSPAEERAGLPPGVQIHTPLPHRTRSAEDGRFSLGELFASPGEGPTLRASHPEWTLVVMPMEPPAPGGSRWVEIVMEPPARVVGRVLADDQPVAGVRVRATQGEPRRQTSCPTNDLGEYTLEALGSGETRLTVRGTWHQAESFHVGPDLLHDETVSLTAGETHQHDIALADEHAAIRGVVRDLDGEPLAEVLVFVRSEKDTFMYGAAGFVRGYGSPATATDAEGAFELFVENRPQPYEVVAWRAGMEDVAWARPGADDVELRLPSVGRLVLSIVDEETGEALPFVNSVSWWTTGTSLDTPPAGGAYQLIPRADGRFELRIPVGTWDLEVVSATHAVAHLHALGIPRGDAMKEAELRLERGTTLELRFVSAVEDLPAVRLSLARHELARRIESDPLTGFLHPMRNFDVTSDTPATLAGLAPGPYELQDVPAGWSFEPWRFEVPDVERHVVRVTCTPTER